MSRRRGRRTALAVVVVALVVAAVAAGVAARILYVGALRSNVGELGFRNRLHIPPVLQATEDAEGRRVFELSMDEGRTAFLDGRQTETWV